MACISVVKKNTHKHKLTQFRHTTASAQLEVANDQRFARHNSTANVCRRDERKEGIQKDSQATAQQNTETGAVTLNRREAVNE